MDLNVFPVLLGVLGAIIGIILKVRRDARDGGTLGRLRSDAELLKMLPPGSEAHTKLLNHVSDTVDVLVRQRTVLTRDAAGI